MDLATEIPARRTVPAATPRGVFARLPRAAPPDADSRSRRGPRSAAMLASAIASAPSPRVAPASRAPRATSTRPTRVVASAPRRGADVDARDAPRISSAGARPPGSRSLVTCRASSDASPPPPSPDASPPSPEDAEVDALLSEGGLDAALARVDDRLEVAMRGEAASSRGDPGSDADAVDRAALAASEAEDEAVRIISRLAETGALRGFGNARAVPRRDYSLAELKLNDVEPEKLLSPTESTVSGLRDLISRGLLALVAAWIFAAHPSGNEVAGLFVLGGSFLAADQIAFAGGVEALALDTLAQKTSPSYVSRLQLHEAAHFLVAYLVGIVPKGYTLSSLDAYERYGALNVQAGCAFCDGAFQREVARGKIGSASLGRFACVALAGIAMEYVAYGFAEGGVADVRQLDGMLRALAFSQKKSDSEVRWAVLNTVAILRRHEGVVRALAREMAAGASVGTCVRVVERELGEDV